MSKIIAFFTKEGVFADLATVFVLIVGIAAAILIRREVFPNVDYDIIVVSTIFPGATAEETEKLITNPIERDLKEIDGIKKMTSTSQESRSYIVLQLDPDVTSQEEAKVDVDEVVDRFDVPEGAEDPDVNAIDSSLVPIIEVAIGGEVSEEKIRAEAKKLEKIIEALPDVARVSYSGLRDFEIKVEALPEKLSRYQLSLNDLILALQGQNISIPGGVIERESTEAQLSSDLIVRTVGDFEDVRGVESTVVRANDLGEAVRIGDVATVSLQLEKATLYNNTNAKRSIRLTVLKKERGDAVRLVDKVKEEVDEYKKTLDSRMEISYVNDLSNFIRRRLGVLTNNLIIGLGLVLLFLSFFLPFRVAAVTAIGIPFAFFATLFYFYTEGAGLNLITMMGLIIVIGMLVDDAVVVMENSVRYMEKGISPLKAATLGTQQIWPAVLASVLTTVMAFYPLMIMTGIFGKFIRYIPYAVIMALLFSLAECFFILPYHIGRWIRPRKTEEGTLEISNKLTHKTDALWKKYVVGNYLTVLEKLIRFRYVMVVGVLAFIVVTGVLAVTKVKFILFPPDGVEAFMIKAEAPVGTGLNETARLMKPLEKVVTERVKKSELESFVTTIGIQQQSVDDPNTKRGSQYAQIMVFLTPEVDREREAKEILEEIRTNIGDTAPLKVVFQRINPGPPVGKPISVGIQGESYENILAGSEEMKSFISGLDGVSDLTDSYSLGKEEVVVRVNSVEASAAGLSVAEIGNTVRAAFEGIVATSITQLDEEIDVRVLLEKGDRNKVDSLSNLKIPNRVGNLVSLSSIAKFEKSQGIERLTHENNKREIRITGEVDTEVSTATQISEAIKKNLAQFKEKFPELSVSFGGEDFDTQESMMSLFRAFVLAIMMIYFLLILLFKNVFQPFLVLVSVPLGLCGVVWTFFFHGEPLSFMALLGAVALSGVVVNNAIVFVDFVNQERKEGVDLVQSIIDAARMRIRPIFLTTITTVCGLLPTAYGLGGLDPFVVPVALALGWGIFFGAFMTVFVIPVAIAILDDILGIFGVVVGRAKEETGELSDEEKLALGVKS